MNRKAIQLHDEVNLVLIPIVGMLTLLGLVGLVNTGLVTIVFTGYVLLDLVWLMIQPEAVPSLPNVILAHHVVTCILLSFPLMYPQLGVYTCWDGICEINTFFLIAKRQFKKFSSPLTWMYWGTFIPSRIILYPLLLVKFYDIMEEYRAWERYAVCGSQMFLMLFNFALLWLGVAKYLKTKSKIKQEAKKDF